ncbi:hypothetical protein [Fuscibacter oryzae]|uniref:Uncharacterized protein n=1 Tax=Fuscibacter oryzae TaxID=2803939 RepID=A0A8J7MNH4_9RHOB|nr:hypothetical protein [Fuscibacter oryzae]MBL4927041.1 hypothetical protein [Fuscibacter oryzae]
MTAYSLNDMNSETLAETALLQARNAAAPKPVRLWKGIAMLAAAAAVVLVGATPMQADEDSDNLAKIIVGGLIVGAIVNDMKHRDGDRPQYDDEDYYGSGDYYRGDHYKARDRHNRRRIPEDCAITIDSRDSGRVTLYGGRCLRDYGFRDLPDCGRSVRIYGQRDKLFSAQCLRRAGFGGSRLPRSSDRD